MKELEEIYEKLNKHFNEKKTQLLNGSVIDSYTQGRINNLSGKITNFYLTMKEALPSKETLRNFQIEASIIENEIKDLK